MRRFAIFFSLVVLLNSVLHAQSTTESSAQPLVITHVTVIDTTGAPSLIDRTVVISGHRISSISGAEKPSLPKAARVIDASGKFLIPSFWDMHVHFSDRDYLPLFLVNGVTGLGIMFGDSTDRESHKQIEAGTLVGPRMVIGSRIIDGPAPFLPGFISVHTLDEARKAVDVEKQAGADFIKVYSFLPRDLYFAIVSESKKLGLPFAGHSPMLISEVLMRISGHFVIFVLTSLLVANPAFAQEQLADSTRILSAKSVYLDNQTGSDAVGQNALVQLKKWGNSKL